MSLSDKSCKALVPAEKSYKQYDSLGLYLEVMPRGSKYWRFKYRFAGKEKRLALGVYPQTSLSEAREKRDENRKLLALGIDPASRRRDQRDAITLNAAMTFELVAREWHERNKDKWSVDHA